MRKVISVILLLTMLHLVMIAEFPQTYGVDPPTTNPRMGIRLVNPDPSLGSGITYGENGPSPPGPVPYKLDFDPYHVWNGTMFTAKAVIENLDIAWALTGANFTLSYNATLTDLVSAVLDLGWVGPGNVVDTTVAGVINVVANNPASPSGTVLVLNMTFQIKGQGTWPLPRPVGSLDISYLAFDNISLRNNTGSIPTDPAIFGVVKVYTVRMAVPPEDVAIENVTHSKTVLGYGFNAIINVTVANRGYYAFTFEVTVYANATVIASQNIVLYPGNSATFTFTGDTTRLFKGNYTISAYAWPVERETNTTNNTLIGGWIIIAWVGDVAGGPSVFPNTLPDGRVDIKDLTVIAKVYGVNYPDPRYVANYDLDSNGKIEIKDLSIAGRNYGRIDP